MSENATGDRFDADDDGFIFVNGAVLDLETIDSAIDALARDEATQADEAGHVTDDHDLGSQESETE